MSNNTRQEFVDALSDMDAENDFDPKRAIALYQAAITRAEAAEKELAEAKVILSGKTMSYDPAVKIERDAIQKVMMDNAEKFGALVGNLEAKLAISKEALERIANHKQTSVDKIYLIHQCNGYQGAAREALGKVEPTNKCTCSGSLGWRECPVHGELKKDNFLYKENPLLPKKFK